MPVNAGLIIGGPGNATDTKAVKTNMTMLLEYWNGHNYQAVEDAYNHGTDTAEGISNISETYTSYRNCHGKINIYILRCAVDNDNFTVF